MQVKNLSLNPANKSVRVLNRRHGVGTKISSEAIESPPVAAKATPAEASLSVCDESPQPLVGAGIKILELEQLSQQPMLLNVLFVSKLSGCSTSVLHLCIRVT